jgi:hypothetical protein
MIDELTKPAPEVGLSRVDVKVLSHTNPSPGLLRLARVVVQQTPEISDLFKQARTEGRPADWLKERLIPELKKSFPHDDVQEEAGYLADEYTQIGDSILLVSAETGRALARITDDDLYQPAPVPRESGNMVLPAKRLKPEVESFIVQWAFDQGREREVLERLLERVPQTALLRDDGDSRLLFTSRAGRRMLTSQVQSALPTLLASSTGMAKAFQDFFPLGKPSGGGLDRIRGLKGFGISKYPIQDPTARNLRFDVRRAILGATATGWVRDLARQLASAAIQGGRTKPATPFPEVIEGRTSGFWIATPNVAKLLQGRARVLPVSVELEIGIYLSEPAGYLDVDEGGFWCRTQEIHDKWAIETEIGADLWVDWSKVYAVEVAEAPVTGTSVEVI